jgi:hypothetical protein
MEELDTCINQKLGQIVPTIRGIYNCYDCPEEC